MSPIRRVSSVLTTARVRGSQSTSLGPCGESSSPERAARSGQPGGGLAGATVSRPVAVISRAAAKRTAVAPGVNSHSRPGSALGRKNAEPCSSGLRRRRPPSRGPATNVPVP